MRIGTGKTRREPTGGGCGYSTLHSWQVVGQCYAASSVRTTAPRFEICNGRRERCHVTLVVGYVLLIGR